MFRSLLSPVRWRLLVGLAAAGLMLLACGGGAGGTPDGLASSNGSGVGTGGTGNYTNGPISGLGSIIVNGVRFDVSQAAVQSDDDLPHRAEELQLGMSVEVSAGATQAGTSGALPTGSAATVRFASAVLGPVEVAPNAMCGCLTVLGQQVNLGASTAMPAELKTGDVVEVYGQPDLARHVLVATRIVLVDDTTKPFKLVGRVDERGVDPVNHTLTVHGPTADLALHYASDADVAALNTSDDGHGVRVWVSRSPQASGQRGLMRLSLDRSLVNDRDEAILDGLVTQTVDAQGLISVNGTPVNVSSVSAAGSALVLGQLVRVEGQLRGGVLLATEINAGAVSSNELEDGIELHGSPDPLQFLDLGNDLATMVVRGVVVVYKPSLAPADLRSLTCIEVEGQRFDDQGRLVAEEVNRDSTCR
jgi:hypothetical protein